MTDKKDWQITLEDSSTSADEDGQAVHSECYARQVGKKEDRD
jgi:hypothetical protein